MGRAPCCEKDSVKRGPWTPEEDAKLLACVAQHGTGSWRTLPKKAGLQRCGKSCRLRWTNYLRPDLKHGRFSDHEEQTIVKLHAALGSRWSLIAAQLPGRTDNDVKNYWNTRLKKKLCEMGIDPITHKPISQLLADLAGSMGAMTPVPLHSNGGNDSVHSTSGSPSTVACRMQITDAALGCFKDDMLNVIMRRNPSSMPSSPLNMGSPMSSSNPALIPPGASSSTSSPTPETVLDHPQLQPFMMRIPPFLQTCSKLVNHNMPHSLSCPTGAMAGIKEGSKEAKLASHTSHNNILHSTTSPSSPFPPYFRFLNPPPTPSPLSLSNNIASPTSIPFHPFLRATPSQSRLFSNSFNIPTQENLPYARSMIDMNTSTSNSTLISGVVHKRSTIANEEVSTLHAKPSTPQMEHNHTISNQSSLSSDAEKFLTSQADLQTHIADPHPWFSNIQEEQHVDKEVQNHDISMFNWQNDEEGNHSSSNICAKSKEDNSVVANWSPTCTSRSSSTCSNLPGTLDIGTHHHNSSQNITDHAPLTSVDAILWDLSDLNAFI